MIAALVRTEQFLLCGMFFDAEKTEAFGETQQKLDAFLNERLRRTQWDALLDKLEQESSRYS